LVWVGWNNSRLIDCKEVKQKQMVTLKDFAEKYESKKTKNIADLDVVRTDIEVRKETFKEGSPDEFTVNVATVDGEDYRVPDSVLKALQAILKEKPDLKIIKVVKQGEGLNTTYTVVPL
jgi:hypothetical protein